MSNTQRQLRNAVLVAWLVAALPITGRPAFSQSNSNQAEVIEIVDVAIGFGGHFKVGYWTPVYLTVKNQAGDRTATVVLETVDGDAVTVRYAISREHPVLIGSKSQTTIVAYAKFGRVTGGVTLRLREETKVLAEKFIAFDGNLKPAASTTELIVTVGNDLGIDDALSLRQRRESNRGETIHVALDPEADYLPDHWIGYDSLDTLLFATGNVGTDSSRIHAAEMKAVEAWVTLGGRLILCVDEQGHPLLSDSQRFASLVPGQLDRTTDLRSSAGLESYVAATQPLDLRSDKVAAAVLKNVRGTVEVAERIGGQTKPIVIHSLLGLGHVLFVGVDLSAPVFRDWVDRPRLVANLLARVSGRRQQPTGEFRPGKASHVGYQDLSGQLRGALDQFEGVRPLPFSAIVAMICAYILLIGPADYFLLKKVTRRMEWTWLSFAVLVAGFCGLVLMLVRATQSDSVHVNSVEVLDIDAESGVARTTVWTHVYSPATDYYDLTFRPRLPLSGTVQDVVLSWQGLPGRGLDGMDTAEPVVTVGDAYQLTRQPTPDAIRTRLVNVPIQRASSKTLQTRWWASLDRAASSRLYSDARDESLRGEFTNPLDAELSDCVILFGNWAYRLDRRLAPGETMVVDEQMVEKTIEGFLNDRRVVESQDVATPWDTYSLDVSRIIQVMLFHQAAGGFGYTDLTLAYQNSIDMTDRIESGRAVLFARAGRRFGHLENQGSAMDASGDGHRQWSFVRIVLPVEGADRGK